MRQSTPDPRRADSFHVPDDFADPRSSGRHDPRFVDAAAIARFDEPDERARPHDGQARGGPDGADIESDAGAYLDYLSRLCADLGVPDPVEEYFAPVVGRWSEMHAEAERWRAAGATADSVADDLVKPLGGLDAAWQGADADSFIDYMTKVGLAGHDMSDAMVAMGEVLDSAADGVREMVRDMSTVLAETAESASESMSAATGNDDRTRQHIDQMKRPTKELFDSVRQVLEALVRLCEGIDGSQAFQQVQMAHTFPDDNWNFQVEMPVIPSEPVHATSVPSAAEPVMGGGASGGGGGSAGVGGGGGGAVTETPRPLQPGGHVSTGEAMPGRAGGSPPAGGAPMAASDGGGRAAGTGGMGGMMPMGGMGGGGQAGGDNEHKSRSRVVADPTDIFGKPTKTSPSVIGDD